jgi:hypothetical protein
VVHGVDAVGGDVHVEERGVVGELEDSFDGDAAEGEVFGELGVIDGERGQVGAEPFGEDFHGRLKCNRAEVTDGLGFWTVVGFQWRRRMRKHTVE